MVNPVPSGGVVCVLFTDLVGSTELMSRLGGQATVGQHRAPGTMSPGWACGGRSGRRGAGRSAAKSGTICCGARTIPAHQVPVFGNRFPIW
jgi:hypothetical protein